MITHFDVSMRLATFAWSASHLVVFRLCTRAVSMLFAWKLSGIRSDEVSVSCSSMYETLPPPSTSSERKMASADTAPKPRSLHTC